MPTLNDINTVKNWCHYDSEEGVEVQLLVMLSREHATSCPTALLKWLESFESAQTHYSAMQRR